MRDGFRPTGEELWKASKDHEPEATGEPIPLPEDVRESVEMYRTTMEHELLQDFGLPEVPPQILAEMESVVRSIEAAVREKGFVDECDESVMDQLRILAIKTSHFQEDPQHIVLKSIPEEGFHVSYREKFGETHERMMTEDEQDFLFQLEMWADQMNGLKNVESFKALAKVMKTRAKMKPESSREAFVIDEMKKKYEAHGFTPEQVRDLLLLSETEDIS
ncbi:hypothetical protein HZA85_03995 [Candidatus Uhrbacteria bacterium]|nr:hypothetical protein [Candidatus Uhrbacteria bacterium]